MKKAFLLIYFIIFFFHTSYASVLEEKKWAKGETLLSFLQKNGIPSSLYYNLDKEDKELVSEIIAGSTIEILKDEYTGEIEQILVPVTEELQIHIFKNSKNEYVLKMSPIIYDKKREVVKIDITKSPYQDIVEKTGSHALAKEFLDAFRGKIDFRRSIKKGDRIVIIYDQKYRLGKRFGEPTIYAAMAEENRKEHYLFLADDGKYYDDKGRSLVTDSFITPCRYTRISSRFTRKRWHPILHRYRAHLGIDYAAPRGTPVKAAYDGKVIFKGRKGGYGKVIEIAHKGGYKTLYAHLSKFKRGLKVRKRVRKGEIIGYVGSTGLSTGNHLHFGLYKNNRAINPAKKIVMASSLSGEKKRKFLKLVRNYKKEIDKIVNDTLIALNDR